MLDKAKEKRDNALDESKRNNTNLSGADKIDKKEVQETLPSEGLVLLPPAPRSIIMALIPEGCILLARKIRENKIWWGKPAWWFKVFCYLLMEVNYKDSEKTKRGEGFFKYKDIYRECNLIEEGIRDTSVDNVIRWMRKEGIIATRKTTRGIYIYINNYDTYQDIKNYKNDTENETGTRQERDRNETGTRLYQKKEKKEKKENKEKNDILYVDFEKSTLAIWNSLCDKHPLISKIRSISPERRRHLKQRFVNKDFRENFSKVIEEIPKYPFLLGENDRKWVVSFDWLIKNDTNYLKILEGKYRSIKKSGFEKYLRED